MTEFIDRHALCEKMYHEAFEKDSDLQRWDSGCWIRYKLFEQCLFSIPKQAVVMCADCKFFQCNMRHDGYLPDGVPEFECRHWCGEVVPDGCCSYGKEM